MFKSYMLVMCTAILLLTGSIFNTLIVHAETVSLEHRQKQKMLMERLKKQDSKQENWKTVDLNEVMGEENHEASLERQSESTGLSNSVAPSAQTSSSGDTRNYVNTVINVGNKYIGNSVYVFGGGRNQADIASGRFDCSAFVHWAFAEAGIEIGSTTDQIKYSGTQVSLSQIQPGDLVFFNTYKQDGHVGIYLGDNKFIGSQCSTGVAIVDMSQGYWQRAFSGRVVRI